MKLYFFTYDKKDGSPVGDRFIALQSHDSYYWKGIDLMDGQFKTFSREKISYAEFLANEEDDVAKNMKVIDRKALLNELGDSSYQTALKELGATSEQLASLYSNRSNRKVVAYKDYFIIYNVKQRDIYLQLPNEVITITVSPGHVVYHDSEGESLSLEQFTAKVLGATT